jgi:hypothetical protein
MNVFWQATVTVTVTHAGSSCAAQPVRQILVITPRLLVGSPVVVDNGLCP